MDVSQQISESLAAQGPRLAVWAEAQGFIARVRRLAETGMETTPDRAAEVFDRILGLCSLAEVTAGELWNQTRPRGDLGPEGIGEVCPAPGSRPPEF